MINTLLYISKNNHIQAKITVSKLRIFVSRHFDFEEIKKKNTSPKVIFNAIWLTIMTIAEAHEYIRIAEIKISIFYSGVILGPNNFSRIPKC